MFLRRKSFKNLFQTERINADQTLLMREINRLCAKETLYLHRKDIKRILKLKKMAK